MSIIKKSLKRFSGIQRRLTKVFQVNKREFYDDYAHHPTEVEASISAIKKSFKNRIITIRNSFHGRTLAAIFASGSKKMTEGFKPKFRDLTILILVIIKA